MTMIPCVARWLVTKLDHQGRQSPQCDQITTGKGMPVRAGTASSGAPRSRSRVKLWPGSAGYQMTVSRIRGSPVVLDGRVKVRCVTPTAYGPGTAGSGTAALGAAVVAWT